MIRYFCRKNCSVDEDDGGGGDVDDSDADDSDDGDVEVAAIKTMMAGVT